MVESLDTKMCNKVNNSITLGLTTRIIKEKKNVEKG